MPCPRSSGSSGARRSITRESSSRARSGSPGTRASPVAGGWPVKLGLVGLASMAAAGLLSLMISWWASPLYRAAGQARSQRAQHQPAGAAAVRRDRNRARSAMRPSPSPSASPSACWSAARSPAMAITLAVFVAIQILWPVFVRPHLVSPVQHHPAAGRRELERGRRRTRRPPDPAARRDQRLAPDAWITSSTPVTAAGQPATMTPAACNVAASAQTRDSSGACRTTASGWP